MCVMEKSLHSICFFANFEPADVTARQSRVLSVFAAKSKAKGKFENRTNLTALKSRSKSVIAKVVSSEM